MENTTDKATAVIILISGAIAIYSLSKVTGAGSDIVESVRESGRSTGRLIGAALSKKETSIVETGAGTTTDISKNWLIEQPTLPADVSQAEVKKHTTLVQEYIMRHPGSRIADYYAEYPQTLWISRYAFPAYAGRRWQ